MKTEQILLALRIAREKSITKAAEESFISQPTASNMLKSLENELGYSLFTRTRAGIELTEEGSAFIEYAATIERSLNAISEIKEHPLWLNLRIAALKYDFAERAFEKLCMKHCFGKHTIDFGFQIVGSSEDGTKMVENGLCDVAILMCSKNLYDSAEQNEAKNGLEMAFIASRQIELTCSEGHPIIKDGKIALELFSRYPCMTGIHNSLTAFYAPYYFEKHGITLNKCLTISPEPFRYRLINKTKAYLLSWPIPEEIKEDYGLVSAPLEGTDVCAYALYRKDSINKKLIDEYIKFCKSFI